MALGAGVQGLAIGQRVAALVYDGGWAEVAVADASEVFPLPTGVSSETVAASLSVYLTAYLALTDVAQLQSGETLLVTGAAGGVGLGAVEIGHVLGAIVVACASTEEKLAVAQQFGADAGLRYGEGADLRTAIKEHIGEGTDVVLDLVAGDIFESVFRSLRWGGRYLSVGFAGGEIPKIPANLLLVKHRSARGFILMYYRRYRQDLLRDAAKELFDWMDSGRITPLVSRVASLGDAPELLNEILSRKVTGKGVLVIPG
jgi:NADPH2:quinone reductase